MISSSFKQNLFKLTLPTLTSNLKILKRKYSTPMVNPHTYKTIFTEEEVKAYHSVFPSVIETIRKQAVGLPEVSNKFEKTVNSILPHPMLIEGMKVPCIYGALVPPEKRTPDKVFLANILGWRVDLLCSSWQINDDIFDGSDMRWDYPCLYKQSDINFQCINYAIILENLPYAILKEFCSNYSWYNSAINLMHDVCIKVAYGQIVTDMRKMNNKPSLEVYTRKTFNNYMDYRAIYPAYVLPTMLATYCSENYDNDLPKKAEKVFSELGKFMAIQDDMVDNEESRRSPSVGNDISSGMMTWLIVNALEIASPNQKRLLYRHYGEANPESVSIVHDLYDELDMYSAYQRFKSRSFEYVCETNKNLNINEAHRRCLYRLIEILYERPCLE